MPGADVEFVRAAREELGASAPLMADANNAYTLDDVEHLALLDALDLMMIEQPLAWDDLVRHAELQRRLETPVCLDESITSLDRAVDMHTLGSGRIVNIKPGRVGGFATVDRDSRFLRAARHSGLVRRDVRERRRAGVQRRAGIASELHEAGRRLAECALLGARHRDSGVDDGCAAWSRSRSTVRASASPWIVDRVENLTVERRPRCERPDRFCSRRSGPCSRTPT